MEKIILKLDGVNNLDVRFFSLFLYNFKVYTTAITRRLLEDEKFIYLIKNIDDVDTKYTGKTIKNIVEENKELKNLIELTDYYAILMGKYNLFLANQVNLEIIDINRGSWFIEFLLNLTPEQVEAYGNAISNIIFKTGFVVTLYKLASNPKTAKYIKDIIAIIKND